MTKKTSQLFVEVLSMPKRSRVELAVKLLDGLEKKNGSSKIASLWEAQSLDRCKAYDAGRITERASADVLRDAYRKIKHLKITRAKYVSGYKIKLTFNDGMVRIMHFGPFLKKAQNPMTAKYRNLKQFKSFHIQDGDLMWGDFEMIFPIIDLHKGKI